MTPPPTGRGSRRQVQVTLEYNTSGLNQSEMLREVICSRGIINEAHEDLEYLSRMYHSLGNVPAYILAGDVDRWHYFIYAAETLRQNPEFRDLGLSEIRTNVHNQPRKFAPDEEQIEIDGRTWGGVEDDGSGKWQGDHVITKNVPIREQAQGRKKDTIEQTRSQAVPAEVKLTRQGPDDAYIAKWVMAEKRAGQPRSSWEGKCDIEFEAMIKYCYGWLRDIGTVPQPYPMGTIDLFWQRPRPSEIKMNEKAVARRSYITARVMTFWHKSLKQEGVLNTIQLKRDPLSYRVILAAKDLSAKIEQYADPDPVHGVDDEKLQASVRKAAMKYFKAHFPVELEGAKPGPLATLDPGYVEYLRLCRKYALKTGQLLHEAEI